MISLLYESALCLFALFALPRMLLQMWTKGKYKGSFAQKLGFHFPSIQKDDNPLIWIHAVSVGETKAVAALAKRLKNAPDRPVLVISSSTETGHAEAKRSLAFADHHIFLPFDFSWIICPIVRRVKPDKVILCETDWWYNFLCSSKSGGAEIIVVNGKISEGSKRWFQKVPFFTRPLFSLFDLLCVQSSHYLQRFRELGVEEKRLVVTGNIKLDDEHRPLQEDDLQKLRSQLMLEVDDPVVVLGSTHAPEEKELLGALRPTWERFPRLKVVIVPRHPERFDEVASLVSGMGLSLHRYSSATMPLAPPQVILVDAMGLLCKCYQCATVAVVAGSFTANVGGHNILEPLYYGIPVVFGPHMHSQPELLELVLENEAGVQAQNPVRAALAVTTLLNDRGERLRLAVKGRELVDRSKGATNNTYDAILGVSAKKKKLEVVPN